MFATTNMAMVSILPPSKEGQGMGIFYSLASFGTALGIVLVSYLLLSLGLSHFHYLSQLNDISLIDKKLIPYITGTHPLSSLGSVVKVHTSAVTLLVKASFIYAMTIIIILFSILSFCVAITALLFNDSFEKKTNSRGEA